MVDVGAIFQYLAPFLTQYLAPILMGSGFTALVTAMYERHEQSKENAREHFRQMVLKPEFFADLSMIMKLGDLLFAMNDVRQTGSAWIMKDDKPVKVHDPKELEREIHALIPQLYRSSYKIRETGVYFLLPPKLKHELNEIMKVLQSLPSEVDEAYLDKLKKQISRVSESLTKSLGISNLG